MLTTRISGALMCRTLRLAAMFLRSCSDQQLQRQNVVRLSVFKMRSMAGVATQFEFLRCSITVLMLAQCPFSLPLPACCAVGLCTQDEDAQAHTSNLEQWMQAIDIAHLEDGDNAVLHLFEADRGVIVLRDQGKKSHAHIEHRRGALTCACSLRCGRQHRESESRRRWAVCIPRQFPPLLSVARTLSK